MHFLLFDVTSWGGNRDRAILFSVCLVYLLSTTSRPEFCTQNSTGHFVLTKRPNETAQHYAGHTAYGLTKKSTSKEPRSGLFSAGVVTYWSKASSVTHHSRCKRALLYCMLWKYMISHPGVKPSVRYGHCYHRIELTSTLSSVQPADWLHVCCCCCCC